MAVKAYGAYADGKPCCLANIRVGRSNLNY